MVDDQIISAIRKGSTARDEALKFLFLSSSLRKSVFATLGKMGARELDLEDVFQDALMAFDRNVIENKFNLDSSVMTYIVSISKFKWLNMQKKMSRMNYASEDGSAKEKIDYDNPEVEMLSKEGMVLDNRIKEVLQRLISLLDKRCQVALRLWSEGQSMEAIKKALDFKALQGASNKTHRCRSRLRKMIMEDKKLVNFLKSRIYE